MPTVDSRLAVVESQLATLLDKVDGGPVTKYEDSIRGRLHRVTNTLDNADKLADALREIRRERQTRWTRGERITGMLFAALTLATPYVLLFVR